MAKNSLVSGLPAPAWVVTFALLTTAACGTVQAPVAPAKSAASRVQVSGTYGKLPLHFEANRGQTDQQVRFLSRGAGHTLFLTSTEAVLVFTQRKQATKGRLQEALLGSGEKAQVTRTALRMTLVGANPESRLVGTEELPGKTNYFLGNDPTKWRMNVPTYAKARYEDVYPGIDLVYYGNQRQLEYDFIVRAGADAKTIALSFKGADKLEVDAQGDIVLHTPAGAIRQRKPVIYQEIDGARREISGGYVLKGARRLGFQVAAYDRSRPLVIDPALVYSTYLGGSDFGSDIGVAIAVDSAGNAYVSGATASADFPTTPGVFQPVFGGGDFDAFVTKINPTGSGLVYSTYLGGSGSDLSNHIAVDAAGNAYVTGYTGSIDFPTTPGAFQTTFGGGDFDAFVARLDPAGSVAYSTYLGGSAGEFGSALAVDSIGDVYVTGATGSADFPTTVGAFQTTFSGVGGFNFNAFVTKLNPSGSALVYSTYLGDAGGGGIAVDASGSAFVSGRTGSADFPTTVGAFQPGLAAPGDDAFVTKLNPLGSGLVYSTYLGGSQSDGAAYIAVDAAGNAYVVGSTGSIDFPTTPGAFQTTLSGDSDVFVTKINPTGSGLVYSTYLGGSAADTGVRLAIDSAGNAYVTGDTFSTDFPTTPGAFQSAFASFIGTDAYVTKLNPAGSALAYSSYLGGTDEEGGQGIAVDAQGNAYVTGGTASTDFPTTAGAFQPAFAGGAHDVFVTKIAPFNTPAGTNVSAPAGNGATVTFTAVITPGDTGATTSSSGPTPPAGFTLGTPPTYYDITTTATYVPPVSVCITYDPAQFGDPNSLRLLHFENDAWVDATTSNDTTNHVVCGQVNSFSIFVVAQRSGSSLTSLGPANIWVGLKNSDDVGIRFDLRAEVYRNGTQLVGSGEVASVPGGSSGFNNARQATIALTRVGGSTFQSGDTVSIKLYVRNACSGSGKNSGTARLWFNDNAANSRFDATIGSPKTYFLRDAFVLATTPGPGPKKTIDVAAGAKCSPYKTFGTWSTTIP